MRELYDGEAVIVGLEDLNLDDFPWLRVVGCNMTSCEHLPIDEMKKRGIKLISLKGETELLNTITSTAEHTIGLVIALARNYKAALNGPYRERDAYKGHTLAHKRIHIVGYGRVGKQVSQILESGFGARVSYVEKDYYYGDVGGPLARADFVSLHIPLEGNEGFFAKEMFSRMKPTAYFINTSRSCVVEDGALLWALENKKIAGAAVDFIDDPELVDYAKTHDNLILTNHLGGCTEEDMQATELFIENKVKEYIEHGIV